MAPVERFMPGGPACRYIRNSYSFGASSGASITTLFTTSNGTAVHVLRRSAARLSALPRPRPVNAPAWMRKRYQPSRGHALSCPSPNVESQADGIAAEGIRCRHFSASNQRARAARSAGPSIPIDRSSAAESSSAAPSAPRDLRARLSPRSCRTRPCKPTASRGHNCSAVPS